MPPDFHEELGEDLSRLVRLAREDLTRHEEVINDHHQTTLTVRGFAVTAVAALIAVIFVAHSVIPAIVAILLVAFLCFVDFYYSRLYTQVSRRMRVLEKLNRRYRRLLARKRRSPGQLLQMRADLLTFSSGPAIPRTPILRPIRPLEGSFKIFLILYVGLCFAALAGGIEVVATDGEGEGARIVVHCLDASAVTVGAPCSADGNGIRPRAEARVQSRRSDLNR